MLRISGGNYICQTCSTLSRRPLWRPTAVSSPRLPSHSGKWFATQLNGEATPRFGKDNIPTQLTPSAERIAKLPVRERLRYWELQNESRKAAPKVSADTNLYTTMFNHMSRAQSSRASNMVHLKTGPTGSQSSSTTESNLGRDEHSIVGADACNPGDLVEIRNSGSRMPILAVFLGYYGDRNHFYASNGVWHMSRGFSALFTMSNFAQPQELEPLLSKLPVNATVQDFEKMREDESGPWREDAKELIDKMDAFRAEAEGIYQRNLAALDAAHKSLAAQTSVRYMSLFQMANTLLPSTMQVQGEVPSAALYAMHTALMRNDFGFQPVTSSRALQRRDQLYEIMSLDQASIIHKVTLMMRQHTIVMSKSVLTNTPPAADKVPLINFIEQARAAVEHSRKVRQVTPYGVLQPSQGGTMPKTDWLPVSKDVILFLELWASYGLFEYSTQLHSTGAAILRALRLYGDIPLTQTTAWTFLQEIGHIMPWECPSRYKVRFPGTEIVPGGGLKRAEPSMEASRRTDVAADARQDVTAPVFCIDATSTRVIDDGISVERAENNEFWIHIHAADPASGIEPNSELCKYMELIPDNIYLQGHFQAMLPAELGETTSESLLEQYSLKQDAPALTFSAKVNRRGDVLDYKVEPSSLRNVVYMEPEDVSQFCMERRARLPQGTEIQVGPRRADSDYKPERTMVRAKDLDKAQQDDLLLLHELAGAVKEKRLKRGAWPHFFPRPSVSVQFHAPTSAADNNEIAIPADPSIHVGIESSEGCAVVANSMVLAGQVAARWCADRHMSVPYRRDALLGAHHAEALAYAQGTLYPLIQAGVEPSMSQRVELARLNGGIEIGAAPGPYFLLGIDMYAKATSPLRRFGDLLLHWQVHAALAHERATGGRRLDAEVEDTVLPFSNAQLADTLPLLQMREQLGRTVSRNGTSDWMVMAVARAWQHDQQQNEDDDDDAKKILPRKIVFTVDLALSEGLLGRLDGLFGLDAIMDVDGLDKLVLIGDVQVADQFEVELAHVNVHAGQIFVKALRRVMTLSEKKKTSSSSSSSSSSDHSDELVQSTGTSSRP